MNIELHRKLLSDRVRNDAFYQALKQTVQKNQSVVLDLGAGTGFLSFLALQLGAKQCFLVEADPILKLTRKLARANHMDGCQFLPGHSSEITEKIKVDILISETLGSFALEENISESIESVRKLLKPQAKIIPGKLDQWVTPVSASRAWEEVNCWDSVGFNLDLSFIRDVALQNMYVKTLSTEELWPSGEEQIWDKMDFTTTNRPVRRAKLTWTVSEERPVTGFLLWWNAELVPGVNLSTSPWAQPTHWEQVYLPVLKPFTVVPGQRLTLDLLCDARGFQGVMVKWEVALLESDDREIFCQRLDMKRGQGH